LLRFELELHVPLPDSAGRLSLLKNLLKTETHGLSEKDLEELTQKVEGYSGADIRALCTEAAFGPIRDLAKTNSDINSIDPNCVRPITAADFVAAMYQVRPSVSTDDLKQYEEWNVKYGSFPYGEKLDQ
jgi:SpoVK/Ycf46/Vps4 family AAA+-type ATPase